MLLVYLAKVSLGPQRQKCRKAKWCVRSEGERTRVVSWRQCFRRWAVSFVGTKGWPANASTLLAQWFFCVKGSQNFGRCNFYPAFWAWHIFVSPLWDFPHWGQGGPGPLSLPVPLAKPPQLQLQPKSLKTHGSRAPSKPEPAVMEAVQAAIMFPWLDPLQLGQRHWTIMDSGQKHPWKGWWAAIPPSMHVWKCITMAAVAIKGPSVWGRPKQKPRKITEAMGAPVWQHWRHLLYHIQSQEVNNIPEHSPVSPGRLWVSHLFLGQENRNEDDAQTVGYRTLMVMWEVLDTLLLSATGISRCPVIRTNSRANRHRRQLDRSFAHFVCLGFFPVCFGFWWWWWCCFAMRKFSVACYILCSACLWDSVPHTSV